MSLTVTSYIPLFFLRAASIVFRRVTSLAQCFQVRQTVIALGAWDRRAITILMVDVEIVARATANTAMTVALQRFRSVAPKESDVFEPCPKRFELSRSARSQPPLHVGVVHCLAAWTTHVRGTAPINYGGATGRAWVLRSALWRAMGSPFLLVRDTLLGEAARVGAWDASELLAALSRNCFTAIGTDHWLGEVHTSKITTTLVLV